MDHAPMINIGGDPSDPSYRYKMPAMITKIEGSGNGIKTVILNLGDVARSLRIHPAYPIKFFGFELGAQSKYNAEEDRAIVNGSHNASDLAKMLSKFIQQFILCPRCKLPELKMSIKSQIKIDCAACGENGVLKSAHKLAQYIVKNPPSSFKEDGKDAKKDRKERKRGKKKDDLDANGDEDSDGAGGATGGDDEEDIETAAIAAAAGKSSKSSSASASAGDSSKSTSTMTEEERKAAKKAAKKAKEAEEAAKEAAKEAKKAAKMAAKKAAAALEGNHADGADGEELVDEEALAKAAKEAKQAAKEAKRAAKEAKEAKQAAKEALKAEASEASPGKDTSGAASSSTASSTAPSTAPSTASSSIASSTAPAAAAPTKPRADEWHTDTSKEAQLQRKQLEFAAQASAEQASVDAIMKSAQGENAKSDTVVTNLRIFLVGKRTTAEILDELRRISLARSLDDQKRTMVLLQALFEPVTQASAVSPVFHARTALFTRIATDRLSSLNLLACIESLLGEQRPDLFKALRYVLKQLYEDEIVDDDTLIAWYDQPPESAWLVSQDVAAKVRQEAKIFIEWLREQQEDDDEEEEEEDGDEEEEEDEDA